MERLTRRSDTGHAYYPRCFEEPCNRRCEDCLFDETICKRLAAYEDTGLEPESVEALKLSMMGKAISEIAEFNGLPIDRLRELAEADKDGRVAVVHGRWGHLGGDEWLCTACGFVITTEGSWDKPTKKYCEDCGAKMDGGNS